MVLHTIRCMSKCATRSQDPKGGRGAFIQKRSLSGQAPPWYPLPVMISVGFRQFPRNPRGIREAKPGVSMMRITMQTTTTAQQLCISPQQSLSSKSHGSLRNIHNALLPRFTHTEKTCVRCGSQMTKTATNLCSLGVVDLDLSVSPDVFGLRALDESLPITIYHIISLDDRERRVP